MNIFDLIYYGIAIFIVLWIGAVAWYYITLLRIKFSQTLQEGKDD